jgi:hypothetical protein
MELDELKLYLKSNESKISGVVETKEDFSKLLRSNQKSPINKIKNSLVFEILLTLVLIILFTYAVIVIKIWSIRMYLMIVLIVCLLFSIPLVSFYRQILSMSNKVLSIKANLLEVYSLMKRFVRMYFQITMGMIPIFLTLAFTLGYLEGKKHEIPEFEIFHKQCTTIWIGLIFIILYVVGVFWGIYYFTKWYLNKLYGRYIDELKVMLDELECIE